MPHQDLPASPLSATATCVFDAEARAVIAAFCRQLAAQGKPPIPALLRQPPGGRELRLRAQVRTARVRVNRRYRATEFDTKCSSFSRRSISSLQETLAVLRSIAIASVWMPVRIVSPRSPPEPA